MNGQPGLGVGSMGAKEEAHLSRTGDIEDFNLGEILQSPQLSGSTSCRGGHDITGLRASALATAYTEH